MEIKVRNVNEAFSEIFWKMKALNLEAEQTRNGPAYVMPEPVTTTYTNPDERVLFNRKRDCNPVFHLMESIWMMAGRNDVAFLTQFNKNMSNFSDDGVTFNAAYGYRWRHHFGFDQIRAVIKTLRVDPASRQAVVQIWDSADLKKNTKDKACNTQIIFDLRHGVLNMTVYNRSNDIWWGAYGANAVHFSFLQEFVARALQAPLGCYRQVSHNLHLYTELYDVGDYLTNPPDWYDGGRYNLEGVTPYPILDGDNWKSFLYECSRFCESPFTPQSYKHSFFNDVAVPMANVIHSRRNKLSDGMDWVAQVGATDWRLAATNWVEQREINKMNRGG
jgi:thymidylate synthase